MGRGRERVRMVFRFLGLGGGWWKLFFKVGKGGEMCLGVEGRKVSFVLDYIAMEMFNLIYGDRLGGK